MRHDQQSLLSKLSGVRIESDGSAIADCPVCDDKGKGKLKVFADGTAVCYRYTGVGNGEHGKHIKEVYAASGFDEPVSAFITETLFGGKLTLELNPAERGRVQVTARNCTSIFQKDAFYLDRMADRAKFVGSLTMFSDTEQQEIGNRLLQSTDRFDRVQAAVEEEEENESNIEHVISKALPDGRIIEQVAGGVFAIYDPATKAVTYANEVECDGVTYQPLDDDFVLRGGLQLPDRLIEYLDERSLDAEIEACIRRYCDAPERELKLAAKYARLSYVADRLNEISYFRATGERGCGKSRFIGVVGMLCLRPVLVTSPSAASLYRMIDAYRPTLIIDECNFEQGSEDTTALMQVLNCGFQRLTYIPRMDKGEDGRHTLKMFSAFGPKLIGSLKLSDSAAFESRCVAVALQKTSRKDIPFRLTERMLNDFATLRAKLYLWRLRNWQRDYEQLLDAAEAELKQYAIEPRFVQIAIPLYGLLDSDTALKADFARLLEGRTEDDTTSRRDSFDGQIATIIHGLLFEVSDDGTASWREPQLEENKPCEAATVEMITEEMNKDLPEKRRHDSKWVGRQVGKLGFKRKEINRRQSENWKKTAIVLDRQTFVRVFSNYSLPLPADFLPVIPVSADNCAELNKLSRPEENQNAGNYQTSSGQVKGLDFNGLGDVTGMTGRERLESDGNAFSEANSTVASVSLFITRDQRQQLCDLGYGRSEIDKMQPAKAHRILGVGQPVEATETESDSAAAYSLVALDTETEPFDAKRGITPRNAKMIGLALCYDGERADYHTDVASWAVMIPEPEQTVIFHNAKFDLGVLERAGLPLSERFEDTMIASHLLDENGTHKLKELAKVHLDIASPLTFAEADRMRLLDPEVFEEYARNDSRYTYRLWQKFEPCLDAEGLRQVYEMEKALVPVVRAMERQGMRIDLSLIGTLQAEVSAECARIEQEIYDHAGCKFDLHSPAKVAAIFYDKLGVPSQKQTDGGNRSVDKESLKDVRGFHPSVDAILRYREVDKLASTFINVLPSFADPYSRIHPEFKALGAKTGRFSCSDPNVQQMPSRSSLGKRLRQAFIAEAGNKLVVADYSQMELRVLAHYSRDPLLVEAYTSETETDLHTLTASRMFNRAVADVSKAERTVAKMINFGIAYGITPLGLFNRLRPEGHQVTQDECEKFIADYFKAYSGVARFLAKAESVIRQRGYVMNLYGRRRRLKVDTEGRYKGQYSPRSIRQAQNFIIQATAADIAKDAMVRLYRALPEDAYLIAQVHDEFIVECRESDAERVRDLMVQVMTTAPNGFAIPLTVDAHIVNNWGEAK